MECNTSIPQFHPLPSVTLHHRVWVMHLLPCRCQGFLHRGFGAVRRRPPEEVCKPDSVPPSNKWGLQPFILSAGCPADPATDPRDRAGYPRPAEAGHPFYSVLLRVGVYPASPLTRGSGELLPHLFTLTGPKLGGLFSVALSPGRPGPPLTATLPCGVRTFLPASRNSPSDCTTSSGARRRAPSRVLYSAVSSGCQNRIR